MAQAFTYIQILANLVSDFGQTVPDDLENPELDGASINILCGLIGGPSVVNFRVIAAEVPLV